MYICSLIAYKMLLEKGSTAKTSWENKERTRGLIFRLYNCTASIGLDTLTQRVRTTRWAFVERTLIFVSHSLLVVSLLLLERYELVLCAFQIRFQLVRSMTR